MTTMRICGREANCGNRQSRGCPCGEVVKGEAEQKPRKVPTTPATAPVAAAGVVERVLGHLGVVLPASQESA